MTPNLMESILQSFQPGSLTPGLSVVLSPNSSQELPPSQLQFKSFHPIPSREVLLQVAAWIIFLIHLSLF